MAQNARKLRQSLLVLHEHLERVVASVDEEDLYFDALTSELERIDAAEDDYVFGVASRLRSDAEDEERRRAEKNLTNLRADLADFERRLVESNRDAEELREALSAREKEAADLKAELERVVAKRDEGFDAFEAQVDEELERIAGGPEEEETWVRKRSTRRVFDTIIAYKKSPKSQLPMEELRPIDRSVSRIYQGISYLMAQL